jgi:hypothetical protein
MEAKCTEIITDQVHRIPKIFILPANQFPHMHSECAELSRPQHCTVHAAPADSAVDRPGYSFGSCNGSGGPTQQEYFPCPKTCVPVMKNERVLQMLPEILRVFYLY